MDIEITVTKCATVTSTVPPGLEAAALDVEHDDRQEFNDWLIDQLDPQSLVFEWASTEAHDQETLEEVYSAS